MPPTSVFDQDATPGTGAPPQPPRRPTQASPWQRLRELLGIENVRLRGFFDDKPLLADDIDKAALRSDGRIFGAALLAGLVMLGGAVWLALHFIANASDKPAPEKVAAGAKHAGRKVDHRQLEISTAGLPVAPQQGEPVVLTVLTDDTAGVAATVLYDGSKVAQRRTGLATSLTWTPASAGAHQLRVALEVAGGAEAVSPEVKLDVAPQHAGTSDVPVPVMQAAQKLVDAVNGHDWQAVRSIDPTKAGWSDATLERKYRGLERDTLVPIAVSARPNGRTRLFAGLLANETGQSELFCVTWDVDPAANTVWQVAGRSLGGSLDAGVPVEQVEQKLIDSCRNG